jgi:hypothetical protein
MALRYVTLHCAGKPSPHLQHCPKSAWIATYRGDITGYLPDLDFPARVWATDEVIQRRPAEQLYLPIDLALNGALLVDADGVASAPAGDADFLVNLSGSGSTLTNFEGDLARVAPSASYANQYAQWIAAANQYSTYLDFVKLCSLVGLTGLAVALTASLIRSAIERARSVRTLRTIGAAAKLRVRLHLLSQALPLFASLMTATAAGSVVWFSAGLYHERTRMGLDSYAIVAAIAVVIAGCVALVTLPATRLTSRPGQM